MKQIAVVSLATGLLCLSAFAAAPAQTKQKDDGFQWIDGAQLTLEGKGYADTELPYYRFPNRFKDKVTPGVWGLSHNSAGVAYRFVTDASKIKIRWSLTSGGLSMNHMPATGVSGIDVYRLTDEGDWRFVSVGRPNKKDGNEMMVWWTPGKQGMMYLPLYNGVSKLSIGIPKGKTIKTAPVRPSGIAKPVLFYGTSITQGGCCSRPGMAFTAIAGRYADVPVINLGFSGNGKMEMPMVDILAEVDVSAYVLDCLWNMNDQMVKERFEPFVRELHKRHPKTPILLAEDCNVFNPPTNKSRYIRTVFEKLKAEDAKSWANLYYLEAKAMLPTPNDGEGTVDGCHLNDWGMMHQGRAFGKVIKEMLHLK